MTLWKINCMEDEYPGMWQRWFLHQCVAVGWHSDWGYPLSGPIEATEGATGWSWARNALQKIRDRDLIVVALKHHRVGRLGEVTGKAISDEDWNPLVPRSSIAPQGEMGRRIYVRWDMTIGPDDREMVISLPELTRFNPNELRWTLSEVKSISLPDLKNAMNDQSNWVALWSHFDYERALSGYIAAYPHRLEDGLLPYPNEKIRERVFRDQSRLDVLLLDRDETPVIVECKQGQPTAADLQQLRRYIQNLQAETGRTARGILVHGGARKLRGDVQTSASASPKIEIVQYKLDVDFTPCN
ncbi:MAG TPA: hypothetical protein VN832_02675 [Stellaceae bacterium]|nr:hypothetical protein [Stellaceae bacterium]